VPSRPRSFLGGALVTLGVVLSGAGCAAPIDDADAASSAATVGTTCRYPILLVHGYFASPATRGFFEVEGTLRADGHDVTSAVLPPFAGTEARAVVLGKAIDTLLAKTGAAKVNLVAHSQGGLDARAAVSRFGYRGKVASITTVGTPHRGTKTADLFEKMAVLQPLTELLGCDDSNQSVCKTPDLKGALASLSAKGSAAFNARTPDVDGVFYQSWAGVSSGTSKPDIDASIAVEIECEHKVVGRHVHVRSAEFSALQAVVGDTGPNDGIITVESAKWGTFRGCVRTDHNGLVGQPALQGANEAGYDHRAFYRDIARDLAKRGF
jgi:triacylglycerol lipase